jgi:hypothetical protein
MSRSPYFYVERFNEKTGKYELEHPLIWDWKHEKREIADLFPYNGCHELFSIVEKNSYLQNLPEMQGIHIGLPNDVCEEIKERYKKIEEAEDYLLPTARWFTYADMYIYYLKHPTALDYDEDPPKNGPNPIKSLMDRVDAFLEVMDGWDWRDDYSLIRIVYWIF